MVRAPLAARPLPAAPLFLLTLLVSTATPALAGTWRVEVDRSGDAPTIQAALELARDDRSALVDTVLVAPGRYTWANQGTGDEYGLIRFWKDEMDDVHLVSQGGPDVTILDAEGRGRVFFANGNNVPSDPVEFVIDGFAFVNGRAPSYPNRPEREGGAMAMHLVNAEIKNCVFRNNVAEYGGGVWLGGFASFHFQDCRFHNNHAITSRSGVNAIGGGLCVINSTEQSVFERCTFTDNRTGYRGGGAFVGNSRTDFIDCVFTGNASTDANLGNGSALYVFDVHEVNLDRVLIRENDTSNGVALLIREVDNTAMEVSVRNSLIAFNKPGQGVRVTGSADFSCTDIYGHGGGNWTGSLSSQLARDGNRSVDPLFCPNSSDPRAVDAASPMLVGRDLCEPGVGSVRGECGILVRAFSCTWAEIGADILLDVMFPVSAPPSLTLERSAPGEAPVVLLAGWSGEGGPLTHTDSEAPDRGALYRLLDEDGVELARFQLAPRRALPPGVAVLGAFPNPFNPSTEIHWSLPGEGVARVRILDARGREVLLLHDGPSVEGDNYRTWRGVDHAGHAVSSGVYLVEVISGGETGHGKVALVR